MFARSATAITDVNTGGFVHSYQIWQDEEFTAIFCNVPIYMKAISKWIRGPPKLLPAELLQLVSWKDVRCKRDLKHWMFSSSANTLLQELDLEQIRLVIQALLASNLYVKKNGRVAEFFLAPFRNKSVPVTNVKRGRYVKLVLKNYGHHTKPPLKSMSKLTSFEVLMLSCSLAVCHKALKEKKLSLTHLYTDETLLGWCLQDLIKAWRQLLEKARICWALRICSVHKCVTLVWKLDSPFFWSDCRSFYCWNHWLHYDLLACFALKAGMWMRMCTASLIWLKGPLICYILYVGNIEISHFKLRAFLEFG